MSDPHADLTADARPTPMPDPSRPSQHYAAVEATDPVRSIRDQFAAAFVPGRASLDSDTLDPRLPQ